MKKRGQNRTEVEIFLWDCWDCEKARGNDNAREKITPS
jgi:hypothetical protein